MKVNRYKKDVDSLKQRVLHGIKWSGLERASQQILQFGINIVLARLLSPDDFGIMAMSVVFTGFVGLFSDFGMGAAIIQKEDLAEEDMSAVFWFNVFIGLVAMVFMIAISPLVAAFFAHKILIPLLSLISIGFVLGGVTSLQYTLLTKKMQFKKIAKIEIFSLFIGGVVAIYLAFSGHGIFSLAWQGLAMGLSKSVLIWVTTDWRPRFQFKFNRIKSFTGFGLNLMGFSMVNYVARNIDNLLIGKYLGAGSLGYYNMAYKLMLYPLQNISYVVSKVLFPAFSTFQNDNLWFRNAYIKATRYIVFITFPMMFGLFAVADEFILVLYGPKWIPAIFVFKVLCFVGMLQSIGTTVGQIYLAKGRTDWMFRWGIFATTITTIAIYTGIHWGINGVAVSYAVSNLLLCYLNFAIPFRLIELKVSSFILSFEKEIFIAFSMFIIILISVKVQGFFIVDPVLILTSNIILGIGIYLMITKKLNNNFFAEFCATVWNR